MTRASAAAGRETPAGQGFRAAVATHPGLVRGRNEDRVHADAARGFFVIVDGMGGEAAGDQAAELALETLRRRLERPTGSAEERLREAIAVANNEIVARAERDPALAGMGCVVTAAVVEDGRVTVGHVGDARLYLLRDGGIEKMTHDHSPVGEREDRGELDERAAMRHPRRNEVFRSMGEKPRGPLDPDFVEITSFRLADDDALLLCSDGLTDLVASAEILAVVRARGGDPESVAEDLVTAALDRGGKDNVSVLFAAGPRFAPGPAEAADRGGAGPRTIGAHRPAGARVIAFLRRYALAFALGALAGVGFALLRPRGDASLSEDSAFDAPAPVPHALVVGAGQRFSSITDALGAANAGDTVAVMPGTYREQVRLREGVTLVSVEPQRAVLVPTAEGTAVVAVVGERIGAGRVAGFTIRGTPDAPLDVGLRLDDAAVVVEDVDVSGARLAGIAIEGTRAASIRASRIHDNAGAGITLRAGASARIEHNRIEANGGGPPPAPGIELAPGARAEITGNVIAGNRVAGIRGLTGRARAAALAANTFPLRGRAGRTPIAPPEGTR